jgi:hypothetical protein
MSTQVKQHTSLCHIVSQTKIKTMENLAKLHERTVQTKVKVVRYLFNSIQLLKKLEYKEFKTINHLLNHKWHFSHVEGILFTREGIRVQLVDENVIGLANDLL